MKDKNVVLKDWLVLVNHVQILMDTGKSITECISKISPLEFLTLEYTEWLLNNGPPSDKMQYAGFFYYSVLFW